MLVHVNGEDYELPEALTVAELVERVGLSGQRIALERNSEIVPRSEHATTKLEPGDRVEIVRAIGGG
jgi:sulfur carrier protein